MKKFLNYTLLVTLFFLAFHDAFSHGKTSSGLVHGVCSKPDADKVVKALQKLIPGCYP